MDIVSQIFVVGLDESAEIVRFATAAAGALAALASACWLLARVIVPAFARLFATFGKGRSARVAMAVTLAVLCHAGATKNILGKTGADEGVVLAAVEAEVVGVEVSPGVTNFHTDVSVGYTGGTLSEDTPFLGRDTDEDPWSEMPKYDVSFLHDAVTNWMFFTVSGTGPIDYRQVWLGNDPPDIHVVTEGVKLEYLLVTPRSVAIAWSCDDERCVRFDIHRRKVDRNRRPLSDWETVVSGVEDTAWVWEGVFTVGESWEYRVSSTYKEGE